MSPVFLVCGIYCMSCNVVEFLYGKRGKEQQKAKEGLCCLVSMDFLDLIV